QVTLYTAEGTTTWSVPVDTAQAFAVAPSQPSTMYVGGPCCFARSTDGGDSWTVSSSVPKPLGMPYVTSIVVDPLDAARVWVGAFSGVWRSTNGGESWVDAGVGLQSSQVNSLVASPANSRKLAVATSGAGGVSVLQIAPPGDINADGAVDVRDVFS